MNRNFLGKGKGDRRGIHNGRVVCHTWGIVGERGCVPLARAEARRAAGMIYEWPMHPARSNHGFQQGPS